MHGTKKLVATRPAFNKRALLERINSNLREAGLRPIAEAIIEANDTWTFCTVIGFFYTGPSNSTRQYIYGLAGAKRHPADPINEDMGKRLALSRAVSSFVARQRALGVKLTPRGRGRRTSSVTEDAVAAANAETISNPVIIIDESNAVQDAAIIALTPPD